MKGLAAIVVSAFALTGSFAAPAAAQTAEPQPQFISGLICDTAEQAEHFILVLRDNVEAALGTVNREAGTPDACMIATYGFVPGQTVSEVERNGAIVNVIEVRVLAVATSGGLQPIAPKIYYSVRPTGQRVA
ncbi:hypothetical protein [Pseudorhodoplanes sp.]|uniref:hypothetical protein n=1 Tax=Pseudorhodoplanes sp. TaxID=1934341 RepID=UPI003919A93D